MGTPLSSGIFLVASPTLRDPNFSRTVVLLCEHGDEGSMGLVLNRPTEAPISEALQPYMHTSETVFMGGPVQPNIVLVLHEATSLAGARTICDGLALGGDESELLDLVRISQGTVRARMFSGYAGWGEGQLEDELETRSWILCPAEARIVLEVEPSEMWEEVLRTLGPDFAYLAQVPLDPRVN